MDKVVFSVYLGNPDNDNGTTLDLPARPWAMRDALAKLRLREGQEPYWQVEDLGRYDFLEFHLDKCGLYHFNALAEQLSTFNEADAIAFEGLVQMETDKLCQSNGGELTIQRMLDLAYSVDCCHVVPEVRDDAALGKFYVENDFLPELEKVPDKVLEMLDYHDIRRTSDRLCKEHGLSVIIPGQDKGKSYIEHQAAQNGTSYKAKLKAAIDRLLPACSNLEELLCRLQREGYEIKRGKYISARAPDQERFTRLKTLGADYTEEALAARIAGRARPSRQPKQQDGKISLLIDIQNNIKAQQSAGFTHWAKLNNLKQAAKTMNFLTEHGISSYGELESKLNAVSARRDTAHAEIKRIESRSAELTIVMKHAGTYRQLKPLYDRYRKSNDKEKFLRGHESEIILFEAAARELKRLGAVPLPTTESMKTELANLNAEKERFLAEYKAARTEAQEYETVKQNVDALLAVPKEQEQQRRHELE